jgi:hypothetical protein
METNHYYISMAYRLSQIKSSIWMIISGIYMEPGERESKNNMLSYAVLTTTKNENKYLSYGKSFKFLELKYKTFPKTV